MAKRIILLIILFQISIFSYSQVKPEDLYKNKKKLICIIDSKQPYSGAVSGKISFRNKYNIAQVRNIVGYFHWMTDKETSPYMNVQEIYVSGNIIDGKEVGIWKYSLLDETLCYEAKIVNGKFNGFFTSYFPSGNINYIEYYMNGKSVDFLMLKEYE